MMDYTTQLWLIRLIIDLLAIAGLALVLLRVVRRRLAATRSELRAEMADIDKRLRAAELAQKNITRDLTSLQTKTDELQRKTDVQTEMLRDIQGTLRTNNAVTLEMARYFLPGLFSRQGGITFNGGATVTGPVVGGDAGSMQTGAVTSHLPQLEKEEPAE